jgi:hypothetical protein
VTLVAAPSDGRRSARIRTLFLALLVLAAGALFNRELLTGAATPFYRDLGTTQRPARGLYRLIGPARTNPAASFGQPYWGNPNLALAYPFPKSAPLGLHLLLHLAIGAAGASLLFARFVKSPEAALLGGLSFGLSGTVVSSTAFLNATTTIAWIPWLLLATHRARDAKGAALALPAAGIGAATMLLVLGGEPALATIGISLAALLAATGPGGTRGRSLAALAAGGAAAALLLSPWLLEVARSSAFSSRRVKGFSWAEFSAVAFHPARFLETLFPMLFGDPSKLVEGGFWGFRVTQGNPPYLASLSLGVLPASLALLFAVSPRRSEGRFFTWVAAGALLLSLFPFLPGARAVYEALPPLHLLRYPLKAFLAFQVAVSGLAAIGADRLLTPDSLPRYRERAAWVLVAASGLFASSAVLFRLRPPLLRQLLAAGWDARWVSPSGLVLGPVVERIPLQAASVASLLLLLAWLLGSASAAHRGRAILAAAVSAELLVGARPLLPRVPSAWLARPSPLVERAAALPGRVFEWTGKDLDPVRRGPLGARWGDDAATLALAQWSQGWALSAAPFGLRYAYDKDPDGSYSYLTRIATDLVISREWPTRLKWLRATGVGSVIASDVPPELPGLVPVFVEGRAGIPAVLFRLSDPLPGIRRVGRVIGSTSVTQAAALVEEPGFDPATSAVVAGTAPPGEAPDPTAQARVVEEGPDHLVVQTSGGAPGLIVLDRSWTPRTRAEVNGRGAKVFATYVHLVGVPVPAGAATVRIDLAP